MSRMNGKGGARGSEEEEREDVWRLCCRVKIKCVQSLGRSARRKPARLKHENLSAGEMTVNPERGRWPGDLFTVYERSGRHRPEHKEVKLTVWMRGRESKGVEGRWRNTADNNWYCTHFNYLFNLSYSLSQFITYNKMKIKFLFKCAQILTSRVSVCLNLSSYITELFSQLRSGGNIIMLRGRGLFFRWSAALTKSWQTLNTSIKHFNNPVVTASHKTHMFFLLPQPAKCFLPKPAVIQHKW